MGTETRGDILVRTLEEMGVSKIELARRLAGPGAKAENKRRQVTGWAKAGADFADVTAERIQVALEITDDRLKTAQRRARRAKLEDRVSAMSSVVVELARREGIPVPEILEGEA